MSTQLDFQACPINERYLVSQTGIVYDTLKQKTVRPYLTGGRKNHRYYRVNLYTGKQIQPEYVHRLVAMTYLENTIGDHAVVDHINNITTHNHVSNLQYITQRMNIQRSTAKGNYKRTGILQVKKVKLLLEHGFSGPRIAELLDLNYQVVNKIRIGKTFKDINSDLTGFELNEPRLF